MNNKLKQVTHYIIHNCYENQNFGKTVLFKLLYFCDFNYYKKYHTSITGEKYRRLPYGPAPVHFSEIIDELVSEENVEMTINERNGSPMYHFKSLKTPNLNLSSEEREFIDNVIIKLSKFTATVLSKLSHEDTPWQVTGEREIIDYDLVFYRDEKIALKVE